MKNTLTIVALVLGTGTAIAQTTKGNLMFGANINYGFNRIVVNDTLGLDLENSGSSSAFGTGLTAGYFVRDNIAVGVLLGYTHNKSRYEETRTNGLQLVSTVDENKSTVMSAGFFFRQYKTLKQSKFALFYQVSGSVGFGELNYNRQNFSNGAQFEMSRTGKTSQFNLVVNPGLTYFVTNRIGIEAGFGQIGYFLQKGDSNPGSGFSAETTSSQLITNFSMSSLSLGFRVYLGYGNGM